MDKPLSAAFQIAAHPVEVSHPAQVAGAEAEGIVALYDDFRDQRAAQLCVWAVEEVRPILQQGYQLPRPLCRMPVCAA